MDTILVDTSVWINFFKGHETKASKYLMDNLSKTLLATCPTIVQEVLQGIENDQVFQQISTHFDQFIQLPCDDEYQLAVQSANLYRGLRKKGITIRKSNDCIIACYALNHDLAILYDDKDFSFIAENSPLKTLSI